MTQENKKRNRLLSLVSVVVTLVIFGIIFWVMTRSPNVKSAADISTSSESNQPQKIFSIDQNGFHLNLSSDFDKNKIYFEEDDSVYIENDGLYSDSFQLTKEGLDILTSFLFDNKQAFNFPKQNTSTDSYQLEAIKYNWELNMLSLCIKSDNLEHSDIIFSLNKDFNIVDVTIGE